MIAHYESVHFKLRKGGVRLLKIFGKEYQLIRLASWLMLVMGIIILGLKGLLFMVFEIPFIDRSTLVGIVIICYGYYNLFIDKKNDRL